MTDTKAADRQYHNYQDAAARIRSQQHEADRLRKESADLMIRVTAINADIALNRIALDALPRGNPRTRRDPNVSNP